ncbi:MAG TPA: hypothetical protein VJY62_20780 [Bacteroidia bacterium]|nr:hypothetical protein [Bacteroidia bacterium]
MYDSTTEKINSNEFEVENFIIDNCNIALFESNSNYSKFYKTQEFEKTIEWVDVNQRIWGISHVIEATLRQYCELIKKYHR